MARAYLVRRPGQVGIPVDTPYARIENQMATMVFGVIDVFALYMEYRLDQSRQEKCYFELAVPVQGPLGPTPQCSPATQN